MGSETVEPGRSRGLLHVHGHEAGMAGDETEAYKGRCSCAPDTLKN